MSTEISESHETMDLAESSPPRHDVELFISVVVPIRDEENFIATTLDGLIHQDYPVDAFEILVVDGGSRDRSREIVSGYAKRHANLSLHDNPKRWSSAARNIGVELANGDVVVIVDGHCRFHDDQYLKNIATGFSNPEIDCLGRPQPLDTEQGSLWPRAIATARSSQLGHHPDSFVFSNQQLLVPAHSVAVAYRISVFKRTGGFDEQFDACEDVELNHRIDLSGLKCLLVPNISLSYHPRASLAGLFRQLERYGRGRMRLLKKHPDTFSIKSLIPGFFVSFTILGLVLAIAFPGVCLAPYLAILGVYIAAVTSFSFYLAIVNRRISFALMLPAVFSVIHFGAGLGLVKELFLGSSHPK